MKGLILKNAFYDAPVYAHQCARIKEELEKLGIAADVRANDFFPASLDGDVHAETGYDFCVFLDKDKYVGEMLERAGMRLATTKCSPRYGCRASACPCRARCPGCCAIRRARR